MSALSYQNVEGDCIIIITIFVYELLIKSIAVYPKLSINHRYDIELK